jgi:DNA-directed RNA polymerase subunit RPC12/RpoP
VLQLLWILIALGAACLAMAFLAWLPYIVGGALALGLLVWILVSTLWPSAPDRKCPKCGARGLVKIERGEPGVRCELCGFRDETMQVAYLDDW